MESLKQMFHSIHRRKAPSGDPNIPEYVKMAKRLKTDIGDEALIGTGDAEYDMDDQGSVVSSDGTV